RRCLPHRVEQAAAALHRALELVGVGDLDRAPEVGLRLTATAAASSLGVLLEPLAQLRQPARGLFLVARRLEWVAALERLLRALHVAGGLPQLGARLGIERRLFGTLVELLGEAVRRGAGFALARRVGAHLL